MSKTRFFQPDPYNNIKKTLILKKKPLITLKTE